MAIADNNMMVNHYHGRTGDVVFRRRGKKTVAAKRPDFSKRVLSELQKESNDRFREAMNYARKAKEDPDLWAFYKKKRKGSQTTCNVAVCDYMSPPKLSSVDISHYNGVAGNPIQILVSDRYFVKSVKVSILDAAGREVENGEAVSFAYSCFEWSYTAKMQNPAWQEGRFVFTVRDLPGNTVVTFLEKDSVEFSPSQPSKISPLKYFQSGDWTLRDVKPMVRRTKGGARAEARRKKDSPRWKIWLWGRLLRTSQFTLKTSN